MSIRNENLQPLEPFFRNQGGFKLDVLASGLISAAWKLIVVNLLCELERTVAQWQSTHFPCRRSHAPSLASPLRDGRDSLPDTLESHCQSVSAVG